MRIFLDANILFSAAKSNGAMRTFIAHLIKARHTLVADSYVVEEARRNLETKFPQSSGDFSQLFTKLEVSRLAPPPLDTRIVPQLPEKDRPVLAAAIHLRCSALITGDKAHFGKRYNKSIEGVFVGSAAGLLNSPLMSSK